MKAAIDSRPFTQSIFDAFDYSGLQLHLLSHRPMATFLEGAQLSENAMLLEVPIPQDLFWSNGSKILPSHYLGGIKKVLSGNIFIEKFLFRHVTQIYTSQSSVCFRSRVPNPRLLDVLTIPNFCPLPPDAGLSSGAWILTDTHSGGWELNGNVFSSNPEPFQKHLSVQLVETPEANLDSFSKNTLDITADTAFLFDRVHSSFEDARLEKTWTGLECALGFGGSLLGPDALLLRQKIQSICRKISFDQITHGECPRGSKLSIFSKRKDSQEDLVCPALRSPLVLAYDPHYPNQAIAETLAENFQREGIRVQVQMDSYYSPHVQYDLKVILQRPLGAGIVSSDFFKFSSLLFGGVLKNNPRAQLAYARLLSKTEVDLCMNFFELENFVRTEVLEVPLFEIPSLALIRTSARVLMNPLTNPIRVKHPGRIAA